MPPRRCDGAGIESANAEISAGPDECRGLRARTRRKNCYDEFFGHGGRNEVFILRECLGREADSRFVARQIPLAVVTPIRVLLDASPRFRRQIVGQVVAKRIDEGTADHMRPHCLDATSASGLRAAESSRIARARTASAYRQHEECGA